MSIEISPKSFFEQPSVADMRLIACPGAEELTGLIDKHLTRWAREAGIDKETFIIPCDCPRFQSGDAKGLVKESVRGDDIFIVVDPGNYSVTYKLFNYENHMSQVFGHSYFCYSTVFVSIEYFTSSSTGILCGYL